MLLGTIEDGDFIKSTTSATKSARLRPAGRAVLSLLTGRKRSRGLPRSY